ncbi:MAG: N-acetylglucosamine-6-phosphate deacetylase [Acidimicrobiales bacterium]
MLRLSAPLVITGNGELRPGTVGIEGATVVSVEEGEAAGASRLAGGILAPGLVDLQVNGSFGIDLGGAGAEVILSLAARMPEAGVTSFLPTFVSAPLGELCDALAATRVAMRAPAGGEGARVLGAHVEGPFLARARAGAHDPSFLCAPEGRSVARLASAGEGVLRVMTLAPELPGALEAIAGLTSSGIVVSAGHTDATAGELDRACSAGLSMVTHVFNASRPLHHREPGPAGQAMVDGRLTMGLIADLHHVHPLVCRLLFAAAPGRVVLVSDATAAAGMGPGRYLLAGRPVTVAPGAPPMTADGTLAGSNLLLADAVANVAGLGTGMEVAVAAATSLPAALVGRPDLGRIAPGLPADLVWLAPGEAGAGLEVKATMVAGHICYGGFGG